MSKLFSKQLKSDINAIFFLTNNVLVFNENMILTSKIKQNDGFNIKTLCRKLQCAEKNWDIMSKKCKKLQKN